LAISAAGKATVSNGTGIITGDTAAISAANVSVTGNAGLIEATAANGRAITATGDANVTNGAGTIQALASGGVAISADGKATVNNGTGTIAGGTVGIAGSTIDVSNTAGGSISGGIVGINGLTVTVSGNSGTIEATGNSGSALNANGDITVNNNTGVIRALSGGAVAISGLTVTVDNRAGGQIRADQSAIVGTSANVSNAGVIQSINDVAVTSEGTVTVANTTRTATISGKTVGLRGSSVNVTSNAGLIEATSGIAVLSTNDATVTGNSGTISGGGGISAQTVNVTGNEGTIEATAANGVAIRAATTANVANGTGTIRANSNNNDGRAIVADSVNVTANAGKIEATNTGGIAIAAINAKVNNTGGSITGGDLGIRATTIDVTNASGGAITGGNVGITGSGTVMNAGTISGATASVQFTGTGTNTLTLQTGSVLNGDASGSLGATNNLVLQGTGMANNRFTGFQSLDVQASGTWALNGDTQAVSATVSSGALVIGDASHPDAQLHGNVTVNANAELRGQGTISGDVAVLSGGTLAPAVLSASGGLAPVATLTVGGNISFASGSTFRVNANSDGTADKVAAGTATLNGGTVDVRAGGTFRPLTQYVILQTNSGVSGTFSNVTSNLAFLTPSLTYGASNVFLELVSNSTVAGSNGFAGAAQTRNQTAVATALDGSATSNPLATALLNQSVDGARRAFDALSGEVYGSVHNAQAEEAQFARGAMLGRMRQASYAGAPGELGALGFAGPQLAYASDPATAAQASAYPVKAPYGPSRDLTFWSLGLGGWGHSDGDGNAASLKSRFGGFLSGVDARFGESWRAGFTAGYVRTDLHANDRASSAGIDSVQLGAYATGRLGVFNVRGGGSYSFDDIDASRSIFFPGFIDQTKARLHGNVGQVFGEVGYGMALGSVAVEPLAGLAYVHLRNGSFNESGGAAALAGSATHENLGYSSLGLRLASIMPLANGTVLVPRATVAWQYAFGDVTPSAALAFQGTGTAFSVAGVPVARNSALVEGGFDWRFTPQAKLGVSYLGELAASAQTHAIKGAFTWDF
jgi:outer membrane autotransporter protein